MAIQYYGLNRGENEDDVTTGASTTSKKLEVTLDLTGGFERSEVLLALEKIANYILEHDFPPA